MKYLIVSTFEIDGHSSASACICTGPEQKKRYLKSLLWDEETNKMYPTDYMSAKEEDGSEVWYGHWDCGQWSVRIIPFKAYKDIAAKEYYTQTG